jgi:putative addiction module component (TIGR02574 family)
VRSEPAPVVSFTSTGYTPFVTSTAKKILDDALALPQAERRLLAEALLESTADESEHELDPAWREEVLRRIEQVRRGEVEPEPWSEVRRQIRAALAR